MERETVAGTPAPADNLENRCYRNLAMGGALLAIGLALTMTLVLAWWGVPLVILGGIIVAYSVLGALREFNRRGIDVRCPYCQKQYRILPSSPHLLCDDCQREVPIPRAA